MPWPAARVDELINKRIEEIIMKTSLIALIAGCVVASSAFAFTDAVPTSPPHASLRDAVPTSPPHASLRDAVPTSPPHASLRDAVPTSPPHASLTDAVPTSPPHQI
jgi:hypothetical protein